jgi:hypothetical protein
MILLTYRHGGRAAEAAICDGTKSTSRRGAARPPGNENLNATMNAEPERSSAELRDDLRRLLTGMGVEPRIIEAIVGPRGEVKLLEDDGGAKH